MSGKRPPDLCRLDAYIYLERFSKFREHQPGWTVAGENKFIAFVATLVRLRMINSIL